jgi:RHS repeat-associated protein
MTLSAACAANAGFSRSHFTGKERDQESGNDYFGARYYASSMGRFMSPDPGWFKEADLTNPQTWNLYSYALNNPLKLVDPTGMDQCIWDDGSSDDRPEDGGATQQECADQGGNWAPDTDTTITVNANGSPGTCTGNCPDTTSPTIISQICASLPDASVAGIGGATGGVGGPMGSLELVTNYNTGQVSGFASGGVYAGWNGGASATAFTGQVWNVGTNNANYSGGFTGGSASVGPVSVNGAMSSGGVAGNPAQLNPQGAFAVTAGLSATLIPSPGAGNLNATNYSQPLNLGHYWGLLAGGPGTISTFVAKQVCNAITGVSGSN